MVRGAHAPVVRKRLAARDPVRAVVNVAALKVRFTGLTQNSQVDPAV
jgi:hypothetical protein